MSFHYPSQGSYGPSNSYGASGPYNSAYGASYGPSDAAYTEPDPRSSKSTHREEPKSWFLPGYGISRQVILNHYQFFLGPSATIRPFRYQHREGYMLTHTGKTLTKVRTALLEEPEVELKLE